MHPGKDIRQLAPSAASDKSDVTRAEGGGAVSTLVQLDQITSKSRAYWRKIPMFEFCVSWTLDSPGKNSHWCPLISCLGVAKSANNCLPWPPGASLHPQPPQLPPMTTTTTIIRDASPMSSVSRPSRSSGTAAPPSLLLPQRFGDGPRIHKRGHRCRRAHRP